MKKLTTEEFINKAISVHGNKYDYSKVEYINTKTKVLIVCPIHGEFWQTPSTHLVGTGCPKCSRILAKESLSCSVEDVLNKFKEKHGDKYKYDFSNYINSKSIINVYCNKHKWFEQSVINHLSTTGCPKCAAENTGIKLRLSKGNVLERCIEKHGDKYEYNLNDYTKSSDYLNIFCKKHKYWFNQLLANHLYGEGCPKCSRELAWKNIKNTTDDFINKAYVVHGDKYNYSLVNYTNNSTPVKIICSKHGIFEQLPKDHLHGTGCPHCVLKTQTDLFNYIKSFIPDLRFECSTDWLYPQRFDMYSEKYNLAIEYNGIQHYVPIKHFGGEIRLNETQKRDKLKFEKCKENNCILYIIKYDNIDYEKIKEDINNLINN